MAMRSALINVMARATEKAGRALVRDFGEVEQLQVSKKGPGDFVTSADTRAESILFEELGRARPDFDFWMEEAGENNTGKSHRWIIDALDGTLNFLHGVPTWAISVAVERLSATGNASGGEIVAGMIYEPLTDQTFWTEKGMGAFVNHQRLRVSSRNVMADALCGASGRRLTEGDNAVLRQLADKSAAVRRIGSCALSLAYVAAGRFDGYWCRNMQPWDLAAGLLLVREAGGMVTALDADPKATAPLMQSKHLVASNYHLHQPLVSLSKV